MSKRKTLKEILDSYQKAGQMVLLESEVDELKNELIDYSMRVFGEGLQQDLEDDIPQMMSPEEFGNKWDKFKTKVTGYGEKIITISHN